MKIDFFYLADIWVKATQLQVIWTIPSLIGGPQGLVDMASEVLVCQKCN